MENNIVNATIRIKSNTKSPNQEDVLVYNKDGDYFYYVSMGDLFARQNKNIADMKGELQLAKEGLVSGIKQLTENLETFEKSIEKHQEDYENGMNEKYNKVLTTVKDLSSTLVDLVKSNGGN